MQDHDTPPIARLLRLPDEILLKVALRLDTPKDLRQLALAHSRFPSVAQEALVHSGRISVKNVPEYITLLAKHPGWVNQIKCIEFKQDARPSYAAFAPGYIAQEVCASLVRGLILNVSDEQRDAELSLDLEYFESWLLILLAILPNAKVLTIRSEDSSYDPRLGSLLDAGGLRVDGYLGLRNGLFGKVIERLETISLLLDGPFVRRPKPFPSFAHFAALKVLTISGGFLTDSRAEHPLKVLPRQLECLKLTCDKDTCPWDWMDELQEAECDDSFPSLRYVQLFVDDTRRSFADNIAHPKHLHGFLFDCSPFSPHRYLSQSAKTRDILISWEESKVSFKTYFRETKS